MGLTTTNRSKPKGVQTVLTEAMANLNALKLIEEVETEASSSTPSRRSRKRAARKASARARKSNNSESSSPPTSPVSPEASTLVLTPLLPGLPPPPFLPFTEARMRKVQTLLLRPANAPRGMSTCVVCLDQDPEHALLPCGHLCLCTDCLKRTQQWDRCPLCESNVEHIVRIYT